MESEQTLRSRRGDRLLEYFLLQVQDFDQTLLDFDVWDNQKDQDEIAQQIADLESQLGDAQNQQSNLQQGIIK